MQCKLTSREEREALHKQIEALGLTNWRARAILHAMVEAGTLAVIECQLPGCYLETREFVRSPSRGYQRRGLVIDHITPQLQGGSDRPENLRPIHGYCNVARNSGWKHKQEVRDALSVAARERESWRAAVAGRQPGWNRKTREDDQRGGRLPKLTKEQVLEIRRRYAEGERQRALSEEFGVSHPTIIKAVHGRDPYAW